MISRVTELINKAIESICKASGLVSNQKNSKKSYKSKKTFVVLVTVTFILCILLNGCGHKNDTSHLEQVTNYSEQMTNPYPNLNDDDIVFIKVYSNWAWGYQYRANYITADGNEYTYEYHGDYSSHSYGIDDVFTFPRDNAVNTLSENEVDEMLYSLSKVGEIDFKKISYACDMGAWTVYGVIYDDAGNHNIIELGEYGDWLYIPDDEYAEKICNMMGVEWDEEFIK